MQSVAILLGVTLFVLAGTLSTPTAVAQEPGSPDDKRLRMVRTPTPPEIDGYLDETIWSDATVIRDFHQVQPNEYAEPSVSTEVYLLFDQDAIYVGGRMLVDTPDAITARILRQGQTFFGEDHFALILDPFDNQRSGYLFATNPNGLRVDGIYRNATQLQLDWEGIYDVAASIDEGGWTFEMAIPLKTLSFNPDNDTWGINFFRVVAARDERIAWVSRNRSQNPSIAGKAEGFSELRQGLGLDIVPSVSATDSRLFGPAISDSDMEPSLDLFYKITPSLNAALTFNTDFSATEVDDRQVNLTRFSLFFPEKRDFFLQDLDIFEFGRIGGGGFGGSSNTALQRPDQESGRPFFSRQIGLSATGEPVDIDYGGKLSGRIGRWNLGTLAIRQDSAGTLDANDLFVGRVTANLLDESSVGIIVTDGDPQSNADNSLFGADFRYQNTRLAGGRTLQADAWIQQSDTEGVNGDDSAYGLGISMPNNTGLRWELTSREFDEHFDPAMGFINRTGVHTDAFAVGYTHRPRSGYLRSIFGGLDAARTEHLDGGLDTQWITARLIELENRSGDSFNLRHISSKEVLRQPFEISPGLIIPTGEYSIEWDMLVVGTGNQRNLFADAILAGGEFFSGTRRTYRAALGWRPSRHLQATFTYNVDEINLAEGRFTTRLASLRFDTAISAKMSWVNLIQYDNVSEIASLNSRLHWVPEAGRNVFIVFNHNVADPDRDNDFHSLRTDWTVKADYTFRF